MTEKVVNLAEKRHQKVELNGAGKPIEERTWEQLTVTLRNDFSGNVWRGDILTLMHPTGRDMSLDNMPKALSQLQFLLTSTGKVTELSKIVSMPYQTGPIQLWDYIAMRAGLTQNRSLLQFAGVMNKAGEGLQRALVAKMDAKVERPSVYDDRYKQNFGDTYSYPSGYTMMMTVFIREAHERLELEPDVLEDLTGSVYLLSMLKVLCGHNHLSDVMPLLANMYNLLRVRAE